jgi:shikimate kinase
VILVGFMGAGKTTVGRLLAQRLNRRFVDLDDRIRERDGRTIPVIFRDAGEEHFRSVETECLRQLIAEEQPTIIALGGGAFVQEANTTMIAAANIPVVFLDGEVQELFRRCAPEAGERPLATDENQFRQLYESRREVYMRAGVRVDTTALSPEQVAEEIARRLDLTGYS